MPRLGHVFNAGGRVILLNFVATLTVSGNEEAADKFVMYSYKGVALDYFKQCPSRALKRQTIDINECTLNS